MTTIVLLITVQRGPFLVNFRNPKAPLSHIRQAYIGYIKDYDSGGFIIRIFKLFDAKDPSNIIIIHKI